MPDDVDLCYLVSPKCGEPGRWRVVDVDNRIGNEPGRRACDAHLARLVERTMRRVKGAPVAVEPVFPVSRAADLIPLLAVTGGVYGLVNSPVAAQTVDRLDPLARAALYRSYEGSG
jgi:hypothetical protein